MTSYSTWNKIKFPYRSFLGPRWPVPYPIFSIFLNIFHSTLPFTDCIWNICLFFFSFLFLKHIKHRPASASRHLLFWCPPPQLAGMQGIHYTRSTAAKRCLFLMHTKEPHELPAILPPCDDSFIPETSVSWAPTTSQALSQALAFYSLEPDRQAFCPSKAHILAGWYTQFSEKWIGKTSNSYQSVKTILLGSTIVTGWLL